MQWIIDDTLIPARKENAKKIITAFIMKNMTADEIKERFGYTNEAGTKSYEIIEWFDAIVAHCRN